MKYDLIARAAQLLRRGGRHRRWRRAVSGLAAVVVFVTSYMLILPALTLEQDTICGLEEHTHADACYEQRLVCTLEESEPVYEDQQVLTCTLPEGEGHAHTDGCYGLTCALEESAGHTHTEACYTAVSELTCTQAESEGHAHGEGCYGEDGNLICTLEESAGHTHADGCYTTVSQLTCTQEESAGHTHADGCYGLICGQEESEAHTHTDACCTTQQVQVSGHVHTEACYEQALICQIPEHTHDESCYPAQEEELVCELSQHTHGEGCYDADGNLTCTLPEHTHGEECYALVEIPEEDVPMTAFPEVIPGGYEEYSFDNGSGLVVTAYAPEGAFGQDVQLFAEVLSEDSEEYAQAKENLDKAENAPEYTGMAAMDIRFVDAAAEDPAAAEEIEPDASLGQVYVDIQAQALIPEDVDESTLAVQHHVETESDKIFGLIPNVFDPTVTTVETVADNSDTTGTVTAAPAAVQTLDLTEEDSASAAQDVEAQFAVESFSKFTITWSAWYGPTGTLTVHYVDKNGGEIEGPQQSDPEMDYGDAVQLSLYARDIEGYEFQEARINVDSSAIYSVRYQEEWKSTGIFSGYFQYRWEYKESSSDNWQQWTDWSREDCNVDVYLVYKALEEQPPEMVLPEPNVAKRAWLQEDGAYNLELDISSTVGSATSKAPLDVLFIIDRSGSMHTNGGMTSAKSAAKDLAKNLSENENLDVQFALVSFSSGESSGRWYPDHQGNVETDLNWSSNLIDFNNAVDNLNANGGTNYEDAFKEAANVLANQNRTAQTVVIFLTDGKPTVCNADADDSSTGNTANYRDVTGAKNALAGMSSTYFYSIGYGNEFKSNSAGYIILEALTEGGSIYCSTTNADTSDVNWYTTDWRERTEVACEGANTSSTSNRKMFTADDATALKNVFNGILANVTEVACEDVTVTDTLSQYVMATESTTYRLEIYRDDVLVLQTPETVWGTEFTMSNPYSHATQQYNSAADKNLAINSLNGTKLMVNIASGTITCDYPINYKLSADHTYRIVISNVVTTEAAATELAENGYSAIGEEDTGTHSGELGFKSNTDDGAYMKYCVENDSEEKTVPFPKPVVQLDVGKLVIEKAVTGLPNEALDVLYGTLAFTVENAEGEVVYTIPVSSPPAGVTVVPKANAGGWSITIPNLKTGHYTVTETGYESADSYVWKTEGSVATDSTMVTKDTSGTVNLTNNYQQGTGYLNVTKNVYISEVLSNAGDDPFNFEIKIPADKAGTYSVTYARDSSLGSAHADGDLYFEVDQSDEAHASESLELYPGETATISFPVGIEVEITETEASRAGYATKWTGNTSTGNDMVGATVTTKPIVASETPITVTCTNTTGAELPSTGGMGVVPYFTLGSLMTIGGGLLLIRRRWKGGHAAR